jgi:hypothetical protein
MIRFAENLGEKLLSTFVPKAKASAACNWPVCPSGYSVQWSSTLCGGGCYEYDCRSGGVLRPGGCGKRF